MARNVEIKARARFLTAIRERLEKLGASGPTLIPQRDIFFNSAHGRLKLRYVGESEGQLVYYERPDQAGPKTSTYSVVSVPDPRRMEELLTAACGVRCIVEKDRLLYMVGRTRIHLDTVKELGDFIEFEVVLHDHESEQRGIAEARELMELLSVNEADLIEGAYADLLQTPGPKL